MKWNRKLCMISIYNKWYHYHYDDEMFCPVAALLTGYITIGLKIASMLCSTRMITLISVYCHSIKRIFIINVKRSLTYGAKIHTCTLSTHVWSIAFITRSLFIVIWKSWCLIIKFALCSNLYIWNKVSNDGLLLLKLKRPLTCFTSTRYLRSELLYKDEQITYFFYWLVYMAKPWQDIYFE